MRNNTSPVVTLTTDFGTEDAYVAAMKGVMLSINPRLNIVDLSHSIESQNIFQAAFVLGIACSYFPKGTIHLVVVDPGVGSSRRAILLITPQALFVAPDNGVLSFVLPEGGGDVEGRGLYEVRERELPRGLQAVSLTNPRFWRHPVSKTFHGRDIFAPVAAHLSLGVSPYDFGERISSIFAFDIPRPKLQPDGSLAGHILHIDRFGNLITSIKEKDLPTAPLSFNVGGRNIKGLSTHYAEGGKLLALIGSSGYLEIAARGKSAARLLKAKVGDSVLVFTSSPRSLSS